MNKVTIIGRLTSAPVLTTTQGGKSVTKMTIAVTRPKNREKTDYLDVVAWEAKAELCSTYLVKGQQVAISGEIHKDTYEGKDGTKRSTYSIVVQDVEFLAKPSAESKKEETAPEAEQGDIFAGGYVEEDLPF